MYHATCLYSVFVLAWAVGAEQPSSDLLQQIAKAQQMAFADLEPLSIVYREEMTVARSDGMEQIDTVRTETICGGRAFVEMSIEKKGEDAPTTTPDQRMQGRVSRIERLVLTPDHIVHWFVGSPVAHI